jgi:glucans biosynthesis protein C
MILLETKPDNKQRLYYLDWLRVLAFSLLIISNSARVFGHEKWWIQNLVTSVEIDYVLIFFGQWRMPLLFLVSGATIAIVMHRKSFRQFIDDRFIRILIPLLAGMLLVIPPQIYYIWLAEGYTQSYTQFYSGILDLKWFPAGNFHWLHLWYLAFVFVFTLIILPFLGFLRSDGTQKILNNLARVLSNPAVLFASVLVFQIPFYIISSIRPNGNLAGLAYYFPFFIFGALFLTRKYVSESIKANRKMAFSLGIIFTGLLYCFFWYKSSDGLTILSTGLPEIIDQKIKLMTVSLNQWFWLIAITGYAHQYLNYGHKALTYANSAVYPFYILNQTVIVILSYYVISLDISIVSKFFIILAGTFTLIGILYETVLKRSTLSRLLFGIKTNLEIINPLLRSTKYVKELSLSFVKSRRNPADFK